MSAEAEPTEHDQGTSGDDEQSANSTDRDPGERVRCTCCVLLLTLVVVAGVVHLILYFTGVIGHDNSSPGHGSSFVSLLSGAAERSPGFGIVRTFISPQ